MKTRGTTTVAVNKEISCFLREALTKCLACEEDETKENLEEDIDIYNDTIDQFIAPQSPTAIDEFVSIASEELVREGYSDPLCKFIRDMIKNKEKVTFSIDAKL